MRKPITRQSSLLNEMDQKALDPKTLSANGRQAWIEQIMAPIRKHYAEVTQPQVRAVAESYRIKR